MGRYLVATILALVLAAPAQASHNPPAYVCFVYYPFRIVNGVRVWEYGWKYGCVFPSNYPAKSGLR